MGLKIKLTSADLKALRIAEAKFDNVDVKACVRDLFALGVYLRVLGHREEGSKACAHALQTLGVSGARRTRIFKLLDVDPQGLAAAFMPHCEFKFLIERQLASTSQK